MDPIKLEELVLRGRACIPNRLQIGLSLFWMLTFLSAIPPLWDMMVTQRWMRCSKHLILAIVVASWISLLIAIAPRVLRNILRDFSILLSFFFTVIEVIHLGLYGKRPTDGVFLSVFNTHFAETTEFIREYIGWKGVGCIGVLILCVFGLLHLSKQLSQFSFAYPRWILKFSIFFPLLSFLALMRWSYGPERAVARSTFSPLLLIVDYVSALKLYDSVDGTNHPHWFPNIARRSSPHRETYVVILGESTTRNHLGIYGYYRPTSPKLSARQDDLYVFSDVISPHCHTHSSLKASLSFYDSHEPSPFEVVPSIVDLMNQAGFKTYWLSNQVAFGRWNTPVGAIAARAKKIEFLNPEQYRFGALSYDEVVLDPLEKVLKEDAEKKFIIVHLRGAHASYAERYPSSFNHFQDSPQPAAYLLDRRAQQLLNDYDNAILYTDYIVGKIFERVEATEEYSSILFLSDHGEEVFRDRDFYGHNEAISSRSMFEIPFIFWVSRAYREKNAPLLEFVAANLHKPYVTGQLVHTLQDMAGVFAEDYKPEQSIFQRSFHPAVRRVMGDIPYD